MLQILVECSFKSAISLLSITLETIDDTEHYVNEYIAVLKNPSYKDVSHSKSRPGHKCFLLELSNQPFDSH